MINYCTVYCGKLGITVHLRNIRKRFELGGFGIGYIPLTIHTAVKTKAKKSIEGKGG